MGPGGTTLTGPPPPMQAASPPNQTSFVVSGLSENTQVYTAGVSLGYRISATVILILYIELPMSTIAVSCTVCGNQKVVGSNPIAPLLGVVAQLAIFT